MLQLMLSLSLLFIVQNFIVYFVIVVVFVGIVVAFIFMILSS